MRNQKSGRGMARIRNFEPSGQDGLQTFRFLISDFSRFQEFLLELGVLLGDLLRHLPPLRFQAPGQGLVLHRQDLGGQHSSIFRAVQCYRSHRDAAGHLDCGQQGIQPIQDAIQDGVMEVTTSAARAVADYLALELTRMFLFLVSFALVLLLWLLLSRVLDLACKLPVLSTLNHWSGAALGLVKGGLIVFILCWLLRGSLISQEAVEGTVLLRFFCTHTPLSLLAPLLFR